jgi:hypothetical protein
LFNKYKASPNFSIKKSSSNGIKSFSYSDHSIGKPKFLQLFTSN